MISHGVNSEGSLMQEFFVLYAFLNIFELFKDLNPKLIAKMFPFLLKASKLFDVRKVLLVFVIYLRRLGFLNLNTVGFLLYLRGLWVGWIRSEEKSEESWSLPDQVSSVFVLFVNAKFSLLLDAHNEHVQIFESVDGMLHILFSGIKPPDLLAPALNNALRLRGIKLNTLYFFDKDNSLIIDFRQLLPSLLLSVSLLPDALFHLLVNI